MLDLEERVVVWKEQGGRGDEEVGCIHCLLMRAFDVAPLFAVCTPGSLRLHSDWLSAGGGEARRGR